MLLCSQLFSTFRSGAKHEPGRQLAGPPADQRVGRQPEPRVGRPDARQEPRGVLQAAVSHSYLPSEEHQPPQPCLDRPSLRPKPSVSWVLMNSLCPAVALQAEQIIALKH